MIKNAEIMTMATRTTQELQAIRDEVNNDPASRGYAQYWPNSGGMVVELMNDPNGGEMYRSHYVNARSVIKLPLGLSILGKLDAVENTNIAVKWAIKFLATDQGLDVGDPVTHATIDSLVTDSVLLQAEGDQLKAMSLLPASRAEVLGLGYVSEQDLIAAFSEV